MQGKQRGAAGCSGVPHESFVSHGAFGAVCFQVGIDPSYSPKV